MDIPGIYHSWIIWIGDGTGLPDSILHLHAGMAVLLAARLLTRRSLATFIPFAFVLMAEFANELMDYLHYGWRAADTYADLANTFFWPFVVSLAVRLRPIALPVDQGAAPDSMADQQVRPAAQGAN